MSGMISMSQKTSNDMTDDDSTESEDRHDDLISSTEESTKPHTQMSQKTTNDITDDDSTESDDRHYDETSSTEASTKLHTSTHDEYKNEYIANRHTHFNSRQYTSEYPVTGDIGEHRVVEVGGPTSNLGFTDIRGDGNQHSVVSKNPSSRLIRICLSRRLENLKSAVYQPPPLALFRENHSKGTHTQIGGINYRLMSLEITRIYPVLQQVCTMVKTLISKSPEKMKKLLRCYQKRYAQTLRQKRYSQQHPIEPAKLNTLVTSIDECTTIEQLHTLVLSWRTTHDITLELLDTTMVIANDFQWCDISRQWRHKKYYKVIAPKKTDNVHDIGQDTIYDTVLHNYRSPYSQLVDEIAIAREKLLSEDTSYQPPPLALAKTLPVNRDHLVTELHLVLTPLCRIAYWLIAHHRAFQRILKDMVVARVTGCTSLSVQELRILATRNDYAIQLCEAIHHNDPDIILPDLLALTATIPWSAIPDNIKNHSVVSRWVDSTGTHLNLYEGVLHYHLTMDDKDLPTNACALNRATHNSLRIAVTTRLNIPPPNHWGLFACRQFGKNEIIGTYTGERLLERDHKKRYPGDTTAAYSFKLKVVNTDKPGFHYEYIDATHDLFANSMRYINHSRVQANVIAQQTKTNQLVIRTLRKINAGEEFFLDYGNKYWKQTNS